MPRRDFSKVAFAATGDTNTIPGTVQPDGSVSLPQGFGFDYERDNGAGGGTPDPLAKNIDREDMNGILNEITASIGEIQQNGVAIWVSTAAPYPINAKVRHNDVVWRNTVANNSAEPGSGGVTNWVDELLLPGGLLLRTTMYRNVAGVLQISVDGSAFAAAGSSTFAKHPLAVWADAEVQAGGGGGGSANSTNSAQVAAGSGGGGGGYARKRFAIAALNGQSISVGAGGSANIAGGSSSIGILVNCTGGGPGVVGANVTPDGRIYEGRPGGIGTGGDINAQGGFGAYSVLYSTSVSGKGGSSMFGDGAPPSVGTASTGTVGVNAVSYGSGGSGAANNASVPASRAGGLGMSGITIIREYT